MISRDDYTELAFPNMTEMDNIFSLPDHSFLICNINYFYLLNIPKNELVEVKLREMTVEINSSRDIVKVANSTDMFVYSHTTRDPDRNDFEDTTTTLFKGTQQIAVIPSMLNFPILATESTLIGIDKENCLVQYNLNTSSLSLIFRFDNKINGFYDVKDNCFLTLEENNKMCLYQLSGKELIKLKETNIELNIKSINSIHNDYFACSILDDHGIKNTKIKDCIARVQLYDKKSLKRIQEIQHKGLRIINLKPLPNTHPISQSVIGCDRKNIFIINFEDKRINIIDTGFAISDFNITEDGRLSILLTEKNHNNRLIEINPNLLKKLYDQTEQGTIQSRIELIEQPALFKAESKEETKERKDSIDSMPTNSNSGFFSTSSTVNTQPSITAQDQALLAHTIQTTKILTDVESYKKYISLLPREAIDNLKVAMHEYELEENQRRNIKPKA